MPTDAPLPMESPIPSFTYMIHCNVPNVFSLLTVTEIFCNGMSGIVYRYQYRVGDIRVSTEYGDSDYHILVDI